MTDDATEDVQTRGAAEILRRFNLAGLAITARQANELDRAAGSIPVSINDLIAAFRRSPSPEAEANFRASMAEMLARAERDTAPPARPAPVRSRPPASPVTACRARGCKRLATRATIACDRCWHKIPQAARQALLRPEGPPTAAILEKLRAEVVRAYLRPERKT